jgi:hypothetical protein
MSGHLVPIRRVLLARAWVSASRGQSSASGQPSTVGASSTTIRTRKCATSRASGAPLRHARSPPRHAKPGSALAQTLRSAVVCASMRATTAITAALAQRRARTGTRAREEVARLLVSARQQPLARPAPTRPVPASTPARPVRTRPHTARLPVVLAPPFPIARTRDTRTPPSLGSGRRGAPIAAYESKCEDRPRQFAEHGYLVQFFTCSAPRSKRLSASSTIVSESGRPTGSHQTSAEIRWTRLALPSRRLARWLWPCTGRRNCTGLT